MPHDGQTQGPRGWPNILGLLRGTNLTLVGKSGATAGAGLAGGTTSGAPTTGSFDVGEAIIGQDGSLWICSVAGSPGTFVKAGGTLSPLSTKGDVWVYGSTDSRLGVGSNDQVLTADSTQSLGVKWAAAGSGTLSTVSNALTGNVTLTTANTFYDGPSVSCAAGTWLLWGAIVARNTNVACAITAKLWDGTTTVASGEEVIASSTYSVQIALAGVVTPGSTTTYKISVAPNTTFSTMLAATNENGAGNTASYLIGVKVG